MLLKGRDSYLIWSSSRIGPGSSSDAPRTQSVQHRISRLTVLSGSFEVRKELAKVLGKQDVDGLFPDKLVFGMIHVG